jgi:hypothetical protein
MKHKFILALILITLLTLPLAQPAAAGRCRVVTIDTLDENGRLMKHLKELCCRYQGQLYCVILEKWP